ncbi:hypothetical protein GCM10020220_103750 [Nonomuraea rubra]
MASTTVEPARFSTGCAEAVSYTAGSDRVARLVLGSPVVYADLIARELRRAADGHRIHMLDDVLRRFVAVDGHSALDEQTRLYLLRLAADASLKATAESLTVWGPRIRASIWCGSPYPP